MLFTLLLLLVGADIAKEDANILVQERVAPARVVRTHGRSIEEVATAPLSWGKNGWGFDVDGNCNVFIVQAAGSDQSDRLNTRLMLYRRGGLDAGIVLAASPNGLSSPTVSPDGGQVLMIRGADELVRLDVVDGGEISIGKAWFANWEADGTFAAYSRTDAGCHVLRHFSTALNVDRSVTQCQGFTVLPIGGGLIAPGFSTQKLGSGGANEFGSQFVPEGSVCGHAPGFSAQKLDGDVGRFDGLEWFGDRPSSST